MNRKFIFVVPTLSLLCLQGGCSMQEQNAGNSASQSSQQSGVARQSTDGSGNHESVPYDDLLVSNPYDVEAMKHLFDDIKQKQGNK
jgi:hypothetical protein